MNVEGSTPYSSPHRHSGNDGRPLQVVHFSIEYRLCVAADIEREVLEGHLVALSAAGLHGTILETLRGELDGQPVADTALASERGDAKRIRPDPDARALSGAYKLWDALHEIYAGLGLPLPTKTEGGEAAGERDVS